MAQNDTVFAGSIPQLYDTLMVPLIFAPYAADMAARVAALAPRAVLETAAGSGVVTRALAPRLAAHARYVVTDLNLPMLEHAAARQGADPRIEWRPADALQLPFEDASFDVVCCQFGAMFFPDRAAGYAQARRVLRPGGHFVFSVWDRIEENQFADDVTQALATVFPDDPPRFLARTPHGYHDAARIVKTCAAAASRMRTSTFRRTPTPAGRPRPGMPQRPIARARRCAARSTHGMRRGCRWPSSARPTRSGAARARVPSPGRSRRT